jgi:hypothetical protein
VEASDAENNQCIKNLNVESKFSKYSYFPEAVSDKYKWFKDPLHVDLPRNYNFSLS